MCFVNQKFGNIAAWSQNDPEVRFRTFSLVIFRQFPSKAMRFDPNDRILTLVEIPPAAEYLHGNRSCLYVFSLAQEYLIAQVFEQFGLPGGVRKDRRLKHCL
ncbi:MAG: hypothetical protein JWP63_5274 [Candidatus Solibacter sp.]|nr:hypothetical protein [Candidatus Solibacter sp.]